MDPKTGDITKERVRGTVDLTPSALGKKQLADLAAQVKRAGGFDVVWAGPLYRDRLTGQALAEACAGCEFKIVNALTAWPQGMYEGWPSEAAEDALLEYMVERPDEPIPGTGPYTQTLSIPLNEYKENFFEGGFIPAMKFIEQNPTKRICLVTHSKSLKLADVWDQQGQPADFNLDYKVLAADSDPPGTIWLWRWQGKKWKPNNRFDIAKASAVPQGTVSLARHTATWWNAESYTPDGKAIAA